MKNKILLPIIYVISCLIQSCLEDSLDLDNQNLEISSECQLNINDQTLIAICIEGDNTVKPTETLILSASFYSKGNNPENSTFTWSVDFGSLEIISEDLELNDQAAIATSMATIKANPDFIGNGIINV
ncbi:MAG: hypothetical protein KDC67_07695 [Ignavibacteriae bacterium]|nr:hypothetical protein [Ignavibacteriota bacterium]